MTQGNGNADTVDCTITSINGGAYTLLDTQGDGADVALSWKITTMTGGSSSAALIQATDGNFYGTTGLGGAFNLGTVFKMTPTGVVTVLHSFGESPNDGANPMGSLVQGADGNLYGTTTSGGSFSRGIAFRLDIAPCRDELTLSYSAGTLNLGFTLQSPVPATWSTWVGSSGGFMNLWSIPIPAVSPAVSFNVPIAGVPPSGTLQFVTAVTAPEGVMCFDSKSIDTGGAGPAARDLMNLLLSKGLKLPPW